MLEENYCMGRKRSGSKYTEHRDDARRSEVAVIGAGPSGCMAAAAAARGGLQTLLFDANDKVGRKIYATGNGRCNLTNLHMDNNCYHIGGREDLSAFFARFCVEDQIRFWESEGIYLHDRQGYVYPRTDQASTIAEAFEKMLRETRVEFLPERRVRSVRRYGKGEDSCFLIETQDGARCFARKVILSGGGAAGPQYGSEGDMYRIAESLGHSVTKPLPALVPLYSDERDLKAAAGVRCDARITLLCEGRDPVTEQGELQMTEKGISGIPVFQLSAKAARSLDEGRKVNAVIDLLPDFGRDKWEAEISRRMHEDRNCMLSVFFLGLVNRKLLDLILRKRGLQAEKKASKVQEEVLAGIMEDMRELKVSVTGTGDFRQAQVTSGGVPLSEVSDNLESLKCPGLYLAGEVLDVDGICGGYNLQWAMTSGWIAGTCAAKERSGGK